MVVNSLIKVSWLFQIGQFVDDRHSSRLQTLLAHYPPVQVYIWLVCFDLCGLLGQFNLVKAVNLIVSNRDVIIFIKKDTHKLWWVHRNHPFPVRLPIFLLSPRPELMNSYTDVVYNFEYVREGGYSQSKLFQGR